MWTERGYYPLQGTEPHSYRQSLMVNVAIAQIVKECRCRNDMKWNEMRWNRVANMTECDFFVIEPQPSNILYMCPTTNAIEFHFRQVLSYGINEPMWSEGKGITG